VDTAVVTDNRPTEALVDLTGIEGLSLVEIPSDRAADIVQALLSREAGQPTVNVSAFSSSI
jgi:hypothetical protein